MINEQLWGTNIQYNKHNFHIGTTLQQIHFSKDIIPINTPYNTYAFRGNKNLNIGIDASYLWSRLLLFGETAISSNKGNASLIGIQLPLKNNSRLCILYRNFSMKYQNIYSTAISQNSRPQNEQGIFLSLVTTLPGSISAQFSADIFNFPWMKYKIHSPSNGSEYRILLSKDFFSKFHFGTSYKFRQSNYNESNNLVKYVVLVKQLHNLQIYFKYKNKNWNFTTRIINNWINKDFGNITHAILFSQDAQYIPTHTALSITGRIAIFNAPNYDVRLYTFENSLQYEFNMNAFMNKGIRLYLVLHYNINEVFSIHAKYGFTYYINQEMIGSGYNKINTNHQQNIKIQLRLKF